MTRTTENDKDVREDTMSNRRTLRKAIADVLKQASVSETKKQNEALEQDHTGSERTSKVARPLRYDRGE